MKKIILFFFVLCMGQLSAQKIKSFKQSHPDTIDFRPRSWSIFTDLGLNTITEFNLGFEYFTKLKRSLEISVAYRYRHGLAMCFPIFFIYRPGGHLNVRYNFYKSSKNWYWSISPGLYLGYNYLRNYKWDCEGWGETFYLFEDIFTLGGMYRMSFNPKKIPYLSMYFNLGFRGGVNSSEWRIYKQEPRKQELVWRPVFDIGIRFQFIKFRK